MTFSHKNLEIKHYIEDIEEFYILGLPIKTNIGFCHFLKVQDYPQLQNDLQIVSLTRLHYLHQFREANEDEEIVKQLEELSLAQIVFNYEEILSAYERVFTHFFQDSEAIYKIQDEKEFEYYRSLILKLSCIKEEKVNPNPEIQRAIERSRRVKAMDSEKMGFADIVTSVSAIKGVSYEEINNMTLYQLYMDFYRIAQNKNYETSTLFATVAEKVEIESWNKHIDMFEEEKHYISQSEFNKNIKNKIEK